MVVAVSYDSDYDYDPYQSGQTMGAKEAETIWDNNYGSNGCKRISSYDTAINTYIYKHYSYANLSGNQKLEMEGAAAGMKKAMEKHDSTCAASNFVVNINNCRKIGTNSASYIAQSNCDYNGGGSFSYPNKSELGDSTDCSTIADDDCQGNIDQKIQNYCNGRSNDYGFLKQLKDMCFNEVSKHIYN